MQGVTPLTSSPSFSTIAEFSPQEMYFVYNWVRVLHDNLVCCVHRVKVCCLVNLESEGGTTVHTYVVLTPYHPHFRCTHIYPGVSASRAPATTCASPSHVSTPCCGLCDSAERANQSQNSSWRSSSPNSSRPRRCAPGTLLGYTVLPPQSRIDFSSNQPLPQIPCASTYPLPPPTDTTPSTPDCLSLITHLASRTTQCRKPV